MCVLMDEKLVFCFLRRKPYRAGDGAVSVRFQVVKVPRELTDDPPPEDEAGAAQV